MQNKTFVLFAYLRTNKLEKEIILNGKAKQRANEML